MGYYINLTDSTLVLPKAFEQEALRRFKEMNGPAFDPAKGGGSSTESWYSWLPADYDKTVESTADVFELLGFETEVDDEGTKLTGYDSKTGDEDLFLFVVRDLFEDGAYVRFSGEDGALFEYRFSDGDMFYTEGGWQVNGPFKMRVRAFRYGFDKPDRVRFQLTSDPARREDELDADIPDVFTAPVHPLA
jgi:hypothetical protein